MRLSSGLQVKGGPCFSISNGRAETFLITLTICALGFNFSGCANIGDPPLVMGGQDYFDSVGDSTRAEQAIRSGTPKPADVDPLAQKVLLLPFKDRSKYEGSWPIQAGLARALGDSLQSRELVFVIPPDSAFVLLSEKELKGDIQPEWALQLGSEFGADYVVTGEIHQFAMKRYQATVTVGGYRGYEGLVDITLKPFKVIDNRPGEEIRRNSAAEEKLYGVTNPAAFTKYEKEYLFGGDIAWGSEKFAGTLLGMAMRICLGELATGLAERIVTRPEISVSGPKIISVDSAEAYINIGILEGVQNGDKLAVWDEGRELTDPETGIVLGRSLPRRVGVVQVRQVLGDHLSVVGILEGQEQIQKGFQVRAE